MDFKTPAPAGRPTYLLTWNPKRFKIEDWPELYEEAERTRQRVPVQGEWSTGGSRKIYRGDRVFLLRQGVEPKGIMASGYIAREAVDGTRFDDLTKQTTYVTVDFDAILTPEFLLKREILERVPAMSGVGWNTRRSGISISPAAAARLEVLWKAHLWSRRYPIDDEDYQGGIEGRELLRLHKYKERDPVLVQKKKARTLKEKGCLPCEVCGFVFTDSYGDLGEGFVECHHTTPMSVLTEGHRTSLNDLALVCSNCHRMLHAGSSLRSIEDLRMIVESKVSARRSRRVG